MTDITVIVDDEPQAVTLTAAERGPKGDTGPTGPQGPQGEPGADGADSTVPGPAGPTGATGPPGADGEDGADGATGPVGPQGVQGPTGATGPTGPTGNTGGTGPAGATGPAGPQGDIGPTGPAGPQGPSGSGATTNQTGTVRTTTAAQTTIVTCPIPASTIVMIEARVVARRTGGTAGVAEDGAGYLILFTWKNIAGVATAIGAPVPAATMESQGAWNVVAVANGANVDVKVTGAANNTIDWKASVQTYEFSTI